MKGGRKMKNTGEKLFSVRRKRFMIICEEVHARRGAGMKCPLFGRESS